MRGTLILCDFAQAIAGKLFLNGGGWNLHTRPGNMLIGLGVRIVAPWGDANRPLQLLINLVDSDGNPVLQGETPVRITGTLTFGRPANVPAGDDLIAVAAFNIGLALTPGAYRWEMDLDNERLANESFRVAAPVRR